MTLAVSSTSRSKPENEPLPDVWGGYLKTMNDKERSVPASFEDIVAQLEPLLERLQSGPAYQGQTLRNLPKKGVYVFYEHGKPVYVGRVGGNSKQTIRDRIRQHTIPSSGHNQATFAFRLVLEELGLPMGHESDMTRPELADKYEAKFREQKQRVRNMEVRAVEVTDSMVQAVFEIFATLTLGTTRYNRFDTH